mmetsp:Transcript_37081/g.93181  ORF Transcript_37081/g.93181 Transcript_37081/m.93181 type:complete len:218 (-) Transcript_37081:75-728(-)
MNIRLRGADIIGQCRQGNSRLPDGIVLGQRVLVVTGIVSGTHPAASLPPPLLGAPGGDLADGLGPLDQRVKQRAHEVNVHALLDVDVARKGQVGVELDGLRGRARLQVGNCKRRPNPSLRRIPTRGEGKRDRIGKGIRRKCGPAVESAVPTGKDIGLERRRCLVLRRVEHLGEGERAATKANLLHGRRGRHFERVARGVPVHGHERLVIKPDRLGRH